MLRVPTNKDAEGCNSVGQVKEEAEAGLQRLVEVLQDEAERAQAHLADCQDMLAEMQGFSEERLKELIAAKKELEVMASVHFFAVKDM